MGPGDADGHYESQHRPPDFIRDHVDGRIWCALAGRPPTNYLMPGGLRSSAQMISYELAMTMSVVGVILMAGTFNLSEIVTSQQGFHWGFLPRWNLIGSPMPQVLGFALFFTSAIAENNRAPFDLAEAESELGRRLSPIFQFQIRECFSRRNTPA